MEHRQIYSIMWISWLHFKVERCCKLAKGRGLFFPFAERPVAEGGGKKEAGAAGGNLVRAERRQTDVLSFCRAKGGYRGDHCELGQTGPPSVCAGLSLIFALCLSETSRSRHGLTVGLAAVCAIDALLVGVTVAFACWRCRRTGLATAAASTNHHVAALCCGCLSQPAAAAAVAVAILIAR